MQKDAGIKIITFCLIGNIVLLALKGSVGLVFSSQVLTADAVNSAGDVMSSLVVLLGLRYALKPHDEDHHYGHGKMEALVSLFVGIFILVGIGFLVRSIIITVIESEIVQPSYIALIAAVVSVAVKVVMYKKTSTAGKSLNSIAIMTSAKDHKNDIIATSGAAVAISLALIGQHFGVSFLLMYAEPVMAGVIALFIVKTAIEIIIESSKMLLDAAPDKETVADLESIIAGVPGVEGLSWVKCRKMGRGLLVDAAIEVLGCIRVEEGHDIGDEVEFAIMLRYPEVTDVVIHINPNYCERCDGDKSEK
ncbi:MAG: cation transporter [Clostridia bacterium]|jgi:cation diffusion facilitator family transporter|nr:cation transporter [Clostridia bacterium]MBT7123514.1 cation transporter [Clostridia bacterium]